MNKLIAVTIGDINGIGIEILLKEWKKNNINFFVIFSNIKLIKKYFKKKNIDIKINHFNKNKSNFKYIKNKLNIFNIKAENNVVNTYNSLSESYKYTKKKHFIGIVTLPINKNLIISKINKNFIDQTEFFKSKDRKKISNMIFIYKNKFFIPLTTHIPLNKVMEFYKNKKNITNKINLINKTLINDFKIKKPKFLISGINPHCGENGFIGKDEINNLIPIIKNLKKNKINITGPIAGDSMINKQNIKLYNCFLFTYHDQALIPFKILSNYSGVNYTANLDIIRTSPDHGTGYDLVGKSNASSKSLINAFKILKKIKKNRS